MNFTSKSSKEWTNFQNINLTNYNLCTKNIVLFLIIFTFLATFISKKLFLKPIRKEQYTYTVKNNNQKLVYFHTKKCTRQKHTNFSTESKIRIPICTNLIGYHSATECRSYDRPKIRQKPTFIAAFGSRMVAKRFCADRDIYAQILIESCNKICANPYEY